MTPRSLLVGLLVLSACQNDDGEDVVVDSDPEFLEVSIDFEARVRDVPFSCNQEYSNMGTSSAIVRFQDLRAYVYNLGLTDASGGYTLVTLDSNDFQGGSLSLLDFEDGQFFCEGGTAETHTSITGTVPFSRDYTGLAFTFGVPFEQNHPTSTDGAAIPLDEPDMLSGTLFGYYFFKVDLTSTGEPEGYPAYITSTGCTVDGVGNVEGCTSENRQTWVFDNFDFRDNKIVIDLADLLSRNDLNDNTTTPPPSSTETPPGCQSLSNDPDCQELFISYGLAAVPPTFLSVE